LEIFWIFWEKFFWRIFFGTIFFGRFFWDYFLGFFLEDFFGGFFGGILWEESLSRNKELMFLSRFWGNFVSMPGQEFRSLEVRGKLIAL
jgi:hypothetical protein